MNVYYDLDKLPRFTNAALTIGTFDGVHRGHRQVIHTLVQQAAAAGGESVIITFHPHPRQVVPADEKPVQLINTLQERIALISACGVQNLAVIPFTTAFAAHTAEEYLQDFLVKNFHPARIIIGYDHRFGKGRAGSIDLLKSHETQYGYRVQEIPRHLLEDIKISSTQIRNAIATHDIKLASQLLGYDFFFDGEVVHGAKLGRQLGYPTANIAIADADKLLPADGVYAVTARISGGGEVYNGMMGIGYRPTVNGHGRTIEVNLFDFSRDIYGQKITVAVKAFLREEIKFDSLEALTAQLAQDKRDSLAVLA